MKIIDRIRVAGKAFRSGEYWESVIHGQNSSSGASVTEESSLKYSAMWASLNLTTGTMSTIPLQLFKRTETGRELYRDMPLYKVLHHSLC